MLFDFFPDLNLFRNSKYEKSINLIKTLKIFLDLKSLNLKIFVELNLRKYS